MMNCKSGYRAWNTRCCVIYLASILSQSTNIGNFLKDQFADCEGAEISQSTSNKTILIYSKEL